MHLHRVKLIESDKCPVCDVPDSFQHICLTCHRDGLCDFRQDWRKERADIFDEYVNDENARSDMRVLCASRQHGNVRAQREARPVERESPRGASS